MFVVFNIAIQHPILLLSKMADKTGFPDNMRLLMVVNNFRNGPDWTESSYKIQTDQTTLHMLSVHVL